MSGTKFENSNDEKRMRINEKRRERRQRAKEEDPEYLARESAKRQEQRQRQKEKDLIAHKQSLFLEKENRKFENRQILNDFFDKMFYKNKHTFPTPVSKNMWEKLKKRELDFLFNEYFFSPGDNTIEEILKDCDEEIVFLQNDPDHPCAGSMIFFIKTLVHNPKDQRKLTDEEKKWLKTIKPRENEAKTKCVNDDERKEYKREKSKMYYEKTKVCRKTDNLNLRFIKADPNKVLSIDEITNNPFVSNFSQREQHKIDLWKSDQNLEYLDLWRKQRENYEMEVANLSIEYKENFLK